MTMIQKITFYILILTVYMHATCEFKYENKDATAINIYKSVDDYTATVNHADYVLNNNGSSASHPWGGLLSQYHISVGTYNYKFYALIAGVYNFYISADNEGKFYIDDKQTSLVSNSNWTTSNHGTKYLEVGEHEIKITSANWGGPHGVSAKITSPTGQMVWNSRTGQNSWSDCPAGYSGNPCKKIVTYIYTKMTCDNEDINTQGFGWEFVNIAENDGTKIDPNTNNINDLTADVSSHNTAENLCKRKYQECTIDCESPLTLDVASGKCVMDYYTSCQNKGMIYNIDLNICEKDNQCSNLLARKDSASEYCVMPAECNVVNGICNEDVLKTCSDSTFTYNPISNKCEKPIGCTASQILLADGKCGSDVYCTDGDLQALENCIKAIETSKTCGVDGRDSNLCYKQNIGPDQFDISYKRPLIKVELSGGFKLEEYGDLKTTYCSNDDGNCTFRLVKIYAENDGKELCFIDNVGSKGCVTLNGNCTVNGSVEFSQGIRQLLIENSNKSIVAYNKSIQENSLGIISSSCSLSGKVGAIDSPSNKREIIAAKASGIDIKFWDSYKRGNIGIITFLPTIAQEDIDDGYAYDEPEIMSLYSKNFTGFYSTNGATYAVYNGIISKDSCQDLLVNTSFYITQAENDDEMKTLQMLSFYGDTNYNYNDGNYSAGSCVIKSVSAQSFNSQQFAKKIVEVKNSQTAYMCSPLKCGDHSCQYNQCTTGYLGSMFEQSDLDKFLLSNSLTKEELCIDNTCDSRKPYYPNCGNSNGCSNLPGVYQQENGKCVTVSCNTDEELDLETLKCKKLECKDSIEKDGKCYKTLEL